MYLISGWVAYASVSLYYHGSVKGCNLIVNHNVKALCTTNSSPLCFPWWLHVKSVAFVSALEFEAGYLFRWGFPAGSAVKKNLSAVREMQVWSLGGEDPLEEEMATHSNILAWKISWTEEPGGYSQRVTKSPTQLSNKHFHFFTSIIEIFGILFKNSR